MFSSVFERITACYVEFNSEEEAKAALSDVGPLVDKFTNHTRVHISSCFPDSMSQIMAEDEFVLIHMPDMKTAQVLDVEGQIKTKDPEAEI